MLDLLLSRAGRRLSPEELEVYIAEVATLLAEIAPDSGQQKSAPTDHPVDR
jgi:hypothetical protein